METCFAPFGDSASVGPRKVHGLRQTYHRLRHRFNAPMVLLGDEAQVQAHSVRVEIVLILTQDRCAACVERTLGLEIILDAPDGTPR